MNVALPLDEELRQTTARLALVEQELPWKAAFAEAQANSTIGAILVVDHEGKRILQNQKVTDLFKIPATIADSKDAGAQVRWVANTTTNPAQFLEKVVHLSSHRDEVSRDEIELKDGRILDRYSAPVVGVTGISYGRIWTFRDITERKRAQERLRESEERFAGAFEHAPIGMALVWPDGRWFKVNRALCALVGYSEAELLTRTFQDITHPHDLEADLENLRRLVADEFRSYQMEKRYIHKGGHYVTILLSVSLVRDGQGQPRYFIAQIQDITERKRVENAFRESDEKFRHLADNITDAFWIRSPDMSELHYVSPAYERIWGRSVASLYAGPHEWTDFIHLDDRDRVRAAFAALTRSAPSLDIEYRILRPSGEIRWVHVRGFKVRDPANKLIRHTGIVTDITERKQAEAERDRLAAILESTTDLVVISDADGKVLYVNRAGRRLVGVGEGEDIARMTIAEFLPDPANHNSLTEGIPAAVKDGTWSGEAILLSRSGTEIPVSQVIIAHKNGAGKLEFLSTIIRDISVQRRLEARLFQSRKMETVGELAGGIAHEFNSILTAIIGQSELLLDDLPAGSPLVTNATEINKAAGRAATLTRQLLAYGRRQFLQPEILNLNQVIAGMGGMFHHLLGGDVSIQMIPATDLREVKADAGQIEQVIVNMALNARDAMPKGGRFILETSNVPFAKVDMGRYPELKPGDYVMLAISDTGVGMSAEVQARVFEPFFSTKDVGQGTGLGLSSCYGIIRQSGGHISVYSEPGRGTTFKIYLPQVASRSELPVNLIDSPDLPRGTETILLVEDDPALREMASTLLRRLGYTVYPAANGIEALALRQRLDVGHIDVLFTDVVMPHMSGKELSGRVQAANPHTRTLFTSAYTENAVVHQGVLDRGVALLPKPFTPSALAHKLREVLESP